MSFLFYLKVKKIVLMIFSPILNVIDPELRVEVATEVATSFFVPYETFSEKMYNG